MSRQPPASFAYHLAKVAADALRAHAKQGTDLMLQVAVDPQKQRTHTVYGECVAGATMLAFAVELYLKAVLLLWKRPVPKTHDLTEVFRNLPRECRQKVIALYNQTAAGCVGGPGEIVLSVAQGPTKAPETDRSDGSVEAVLARCKDGFENWRYFHEAACDGGETAHLEFEFQRLDWICAAVDALLPAGDRIIDDEQEVQI